ncbi:MAG: Gfo/Idh/MocA family oxidoreductase [Planctomycetota bacterium]
MTRKTTRRDFLKTSTLAAGTAAGAQLLGGPYLMAGPAPSRTLNVAVVGGGGMGGYAVGQARNERFVALAEIDDGRIGGILNGLDKSKGEPKVYYDYRKMIEECHKDIDVVLISTPDHHHAPAAIRAINRGKHAFCQKPLAHNIYECRTLAEAAKQNKVLTQMGNQGHCGEGYRRLVEFIWGGAIGNVIETHSIFARNFGGNGGIPAGKPVPAGLHWDEWLGPAPLREYHDGLHPFSWRSWRQFGTGTLGDMACHVMDGVIWALKLVEATNFSIECLAQTEGSAEMFPKSNVVKFDFPARGDMPPVKVFTYDNAGQKPEIIKNLEKEAKRKFKDGTIYVGDKGMMYTDTYGGGIQLYPEARRQAFANPPKTLPRAHGGPIEDLFWAIKNDGTPASNFVDYSGRLTEFILTGQLAMLAGVGKKLDWDVAAMKCTNHDEINQFVRRKYRPGWEV